MATKSIDTAMEEASTALVERNYFACEKLCVDALSSAFATHDFERMARILLPLQECRRLRRQLAEDAGNLMVIDRDAPTEDKLRPGLFILRPPRVAAEGRALREHLDRLQIPSIILCREPTTKEGKIPVVALGPVTLREHLEPPPPAPGGHLSGAMVGGGSGPISAGATAKTTAKPSKGGGAAVAVADQPTAHLAAASVAEAPSVDPVAEKMRCTETLPFWWALWALEQLGDGAIADALETTKDGFKRVEALFMALGALPEHEKLHQSLAEACRVASKMPREELVEGPSEFDRDADSEEPDEIGG